MSSVFCTKCKEEKEEKSVIVKGLHYCKACSVEEESKARQEGCVDYIKAYFG